MNRWLVVSLLVACGGSPREVSKIKYTSTTCETNCGIEPDPETKFVPPDVERPMPEPEDPGSVAAAKRPEPTCRLVGEALASLELGNYAEPEEREPKVVMHERRCVVARLSHDDRQCVVDSYDQVNMAYCAPALFPKDKQQPGIDVAQCSSLEKMMHAQIAQQYAKTKAFDKQVAAVVESCRTDRWNSALFQCAQQGFIAMYPQNCMYVQPQAMWRKLAVRLEAAAKP